MIGTRARDLYGAVFAALVVYNGPLCEAPAPVFTIPEGEVLTPPQLEFISTLIWWD